MSMWTMIFLVVLCGIAYSAWSRRQDARQGIVRDVNGDPVGPSRREAELQKEVEELRDRISVLERIATDGRETRLLSDEIEKLRDK